MAKQPVDERKELRFNPRKRGKRKNVFTEETPLFYAVNAELDMVCIPESYARERR